MTGFKFNYPQGQDSLEQLLSEVINSKHVLQAQINSASTYELTMQPIESCPPKGLKIIGQSPLRQGSETLRIDKGNIFIPIVMRLELVRFHYKSILHYRSAKGDQQWLSTTLFRALRTRCPVDIWDKTDGEAANLHAKASLSFSRLYSWNLHPFTEASLWKTASKHQVIELSAHTPISIYKRPSIIKHQQEINSKMRGIAKSMCKQEEEDFNLLSSKVCLSIQELT